MNKIEQLSKNLLHTFADKVKQLDTTHNEVTLEINKQDLLEIATQLRDQDGFEFKQLVDVCAVDYLRYGSSEWSTNNATATGYERGVRKEKPLRVVKWEKPRYAVVYHLLSLSLNQRLRLKVFLEGEPPVIDSVNAIWPSANWFEREAFDLFGVLFSGHPDLRRLLTDYGFTGHPFRKDFPLIGQVEMRYDASQKRVIYEPVSIKPRTLVPKVIRKDNRYLDDAEPAGDSNA